MPATEHHYFLKRQGQEIKRLPSMAKKMVIAIMQNICTPDPMIAAKSLLFVGGLNTSPWTSFQPVSSMLSSRSSSVLYLAMSLEEDKKLIYFSF